MVKFTAFSGPFTDRSKKTKTKNQKKCVKIDEIIEYE